MLIWYSLLVVVKLNSKVLPVLLVNRDRPELVVGAVKNLKAVLVCIGLADKRASLKLDLVRRVIRSLMPYIEVLVGQVQRPGRVLLDAPVHSLHTLATLTIGRILGELKASASETVLFLENALVGNGYFHSGELVAVKSRTVVGELENLAPRQVVAFDIIGVEQGVTGVEEGGRGVDRDTAIEDDGTLDVSASMLVGHCERGAGHSEERNEGLSVHGEDEGVTEFETGCGVG
jgi:hypothetical protein